jgi:hypothetical protein
MPQRQSSRGRKPAGPYKRNTVILTVRMQPERKAAIAKLAAELGHSTAQAVQLAFDQWLYRHDPTRAHVERLLKAVDRLVRHVEANTKRKWTEDPFTALAIMHGMQTLLWRMGTPFPRGDVAVPPAIEETAARLPPDAAERYREVGGVAEAAAGFAMTLNDQDNSRAPGMQYLDEFADAQIMRDLATGGDRAGAPLRRKKRIKR